MFNIKFTAGTAAVAAAAIVGFFAASGLAFSRAEPSAAATVASRFPTQAEMLVALNDNPQIDTRSGASDRGLAPASACVREHWPYIADECLTAPNGGTVKRPNRTITIERGLTADAGPLLRGTDTVIR